MGWGFLGAGNGFLKGWPELMHFKIQPLEKPSYFVCRILFGFSIAPNHLLPSFILVVFGCFCLTLHLTFLLNDPKKPPAQKRRACHAPSSRAAHHEPPPPLIDWALRCAKIANFLSRCASAPKYAINFGQKLARNTRKTFFTRVFLLLLVRLVGKCSVR